MLSEFYKEVRVMDSLIALANSENADIKAKAIVKLNNLLEDQKILPIKIPEILSIFLTTINDVNVDVKCNALRGVIVLRDKYELSKTAVNDILEFLMVNSRDTNVSIRNSAMFGVNLLIEKELLSSVNIERILELFIARVSIADVGIRKNALSGISKLIEKDKLSEEKIEETLNWLATLTRDAGDIEISKDILLEIIKLIEIDKLSINKIKLIESLFIEETRSIIDIKQNTALFGINKLIEKDKLSTDKIETVFSLLITKASSTNGFIRKNALFGIAILIEKDQLPREGVNEVLGVFITGMEDAITIQNALFGIVKIIEKNKLSEDRIDEVLNLFILGAKDINVSIRQNALGGILKLVEKNRISEEKVEEVLSLFIEGVKDINTTKLDVLRGITLLTEKSKLSIYKIEEILDLLEEQAKIGDSSYIRHNAIVAIKRMIDSNLIPENKMAKVLNLFITLKEGNAIFFDGINELDREEITSIMDSLIITKIQATSSIDSLIAQVHSQDCDIKNNAIDNITTFAQEGRVPAEKLDEIFQLFLSGVQSEDDHIKINSLFGIKCFVEQNKLCTGKISLTLDLFTEKAMDSEDVVKITALSVIIDLIKQNKLFPVKIKKILDVLIAKTQDTNIDIVKNALFGINKLIEQNKLPTDKILEILNLFISLNRSESYAIQKEVLIGINALIKKDAIYAEKISEVIDLLIINIRSISNDIKEKALFTVNYLLKKDDFFLDRLEEIMNLFILATEDANTVIRVNGFFGINQLIKKDPLLESKIEKILSLFINGSKDADICIRKESLFGVSELIKHNKLPTEKFEESLDLFLAGTKDRYPYVQKEGFSGICLLLEKDILPISTIGLILDLFIEGFKYSDDSLKRESILGIIKLIDKDQLLILTIKIEEILNLLKELTNVDNNNLVIHNAIIAIGKLAEKDIIPDHRVDEILDLLVTKKEDGTLFFVGITEAEKGEISSIIDGTIIAKINAAHPSINALIGQTDSSNNEIRVSAISKLVLLIKKDKIPIAKIDEVLTLLISQIKDKCDDARNGALSGINIFIERNKVPAVKIEEISSLYTVSTRSMNIDTRKNTLFGIAKLIEQNKLPAVKIEKILNIFISRAKDENTEIKKQALFGLLRIIEKGKFPGEKLEKIIDIFMAEARNINADIKQTALRGLITLEEQHNLPLEKAREVLVTFIAEANDIKADIKQNALRGLAILAERNKIHIDKIDEVLSIFMAEANNLREVIRKHAIFGINQLITNDHIIPQKIQEILDLFIILAQDTKFIIKKNALYGMSKLVEKYHLPPGRVEKVLELFIAELSNEQTDIKRWVMLGINKLIEKKELPTSRTEEILELLIMHSKDNKPDVSLSGLFEIGRLVEGYKLSDIKAEEIMSIFIIMINSPDISIRKNILFWTAQLIEKNNFPIEKIKELIVLFAAAIQEVDIDIKNHGLLGISNLINRGYITEDKISEILNIIIATLKDIDTKENALFAMNALIRTDKSSLGIIQIQVVLDLFIESVRNENINIRKNAIQLIMSLIDNNKIQIDSANEILMVLERLIESEIDTHIRHNLIVLITKLVEHELIPENKIEKILDILVVYKDSGAIFFDGISEIEKSEIANIADGTIINKIQNICSSLSFLVSQARNNFNIGIRETAVKKILLLVVLDKIPVEKVDEVLNLFIEKIKDISINVSKNSFSGIKSLIEKNKLSTEILQDLLILFISEARNENIDVRQSALKLMFLLMSKNAIKADNIETILTLLVEIGTKEKIYPIRHDAIVAIGELVDKNLITHNRAKEILNLFINLKESNAFFFDGMSEAEIEEISSIVDGTIITKLQIIYSSVAFLIYQTESSNSEDRAYAIKQIVSLILENKSEENIYEVITVLIANIDSKDSIITNNVLLGIRELIKQNKIPMERIDVILNRLIINVKNTDTEIRVKSLFIIGDILEKYELSVEKINEVIDLVLVRIRDIDDPSINNALWTIWILTEVNKLPLEKIEKIWNSLIEAKKTSDNYVKKNILLVMCKLINSDKISTEKISVIQDILIQENQELLGFRKVFYIHHNFLLSEIKKAINIIDTTLKERAVIHNEEAISLEEFAKIDLVEEKVKTSEMSANFLPIIPFELNELEKLSKEIANSILDRAKLLLKATELPSNDIELEKEFINELAMLLRVSHRKVLISANSSKDLKSNLIKQIAAELKKNSKLYVDDEKIYIQEELRDDSLEFFDPIIIKVKELLKQHEYFDSASGNVIEVFYVTNIIYDNPIFNNPELLILARAKYGMSAVNRLIDIGASKEAYKEFLYYVSSEGAEKAIHIVSTILEEDQYSLPLQEQHINNLRLTVFSNYPEDRRSFSGIPISSEQDHNPSLQTDFAEIDSNAIGKNYNKISQLSIIKLKSEIITIEETFTQTTQMYLFLSKFGEFINWQYKKLLYYQDIKYFNKILQANGIDGSIDVLRDYSDFRKSVLLKLHPDKGGKAQDFIFVKELQEKLDSDLDINQLLADKIPAIHSIVYKAGIGFKILDTIVDAARLIYEPTTSHIKKVALDSGYLYSMYFGVNGYSLGVSATDILYQTYHGEYLQAFKQSATSISYMVLPSIIEYLGVSYLSFAYKAGMMIYTGYSSITNTYSFYQEYSSVEFYLRSATAYKDLMEVLANSPLQQIYDFASFSKEYAVKVNKINLNIEKTSIKAQLEIKGEFGHKIYDYIYAPSIEEKYDLLNKVIEGSLTKEQAESLKTKHIRITLEDPAYEYCMEIKDIEVISDSNTNEEHYYCYNDAQQILGHVVIEESRGYFEVIERL